MSSAFRLIPALAFLIVFTGTLQAQVIHVKPMGSGNMSGVNWTNSSNLHDALGSAINGDELWLMSGNYITHPSNRMTSFTPTTSVNIFGGFAGVETMISQRNFVANKTILSGDVGDDANPTNNAYHVLKIITNGINVVLDGLIVQDGYADGGANEDHGAGLFLQNSAIVEIRNCIFRYNEAPGANSFGGAIHAADANTNPVSRIENTIFHNNQAFKKGGAIFNFRDLDVINCLFDSNSVTDTGTSGGAIAGQYATMIFNLRNSTFTNNHANHLGGAISAESSSIWNIDSCIFWDNTATTSNPAIGISGGAIVTTSYSLVQGSPSGSWDGSNGNNAGNNIDGDPLFVISGNVAGLDGDYFTGDDGYALTASSNAINAGNTAMAPPISITGAPRDDGNPDMGAYEFSLNNDPDLISTGFPTPSNVSTGANNVKLMEFALDSTMAASGCIQNLTIDIVSGNAMQDVIFFYLEDVGLASPVNSTASPVSGNIFFSSMDYPFSNGNTTTFALMGNMNSSFVADNLQFEIKPQNIVLYSGNVNGGPVNSGFITLGAGNVGSANLIGHWSFNESTGTVAMDSSPLNNSGNLLGGGFSFDSSSFPGVIGNALEFNGNGNAVDIPYDSEYNLTGGEFTFSSWVFPYSDQGGYSMILNRDGAYIYGFNTLGHPYMVIDDGAFAEYEGQPGNLPTNTWSHYVTTRDASGNLKFYINGVLKSSTPSTKSPQAILDGLSIGRRSAGNTLFFEGLLDELKIYNRALDQVEISTEYSTYAPSTPFELVEETGFPKGDLTKGTMSTNASLKWHIASGANIEYVSGFTIDVLGNINDLDYFEIYNVTGSPVSIFAGNVSTGNTIAGNIDFQGMPVPIYPNTPEIFELVVDVKATTSMDNIELVLHPYSISSGNMVGGNFVSSGIINFITGGNATPPALIDDPVFTAPANLLTNESFATVMEFFLDTENTGYNGTLDAVLFDVFGTDPSIDLTNAIIYDISGANVIANSPNFGSDNIFFSGISFPLSSAANGHMRLKVSTPGSFSGTNIQFDLQPVNIHLADMAAVSGTPITSGVINLDTSPSGPIFVNAGAGGSNDGSSWTNAFTSLKTAVDLAPAGSEIWVAQGTYFATDSSNAANTLIPQTDVAIFGGFSGNGMETMLSERDWIQFQTIIDGDFAATPGDNTDNTNRIFELKAGTRIDGLIIQGAFGLSNQLGNGIFSNTVTFDGIYNCVIQHNLGQHHGTGSLFNNSSGNIFNTVFAWNHNSVFDGGAMALWGASNILIKNSVFYGNSSARNGAAIQWESTTTSTIYNCTIVNNHSSAGGAINYLSNSTLLKNSIIRGNTSGSGPANIRNAAAPLTNVYNSNIEGDAAEYNDVGGVFDLPEAFKNELDPLGADTTWFTSDDGLILGINSPSVDAGLANGLSTDITGKPYVSNPDLGAYENDGIFYGNPELSILPFGGFTAPANITKGSVDNVVMKWEVFGGANTEIIDGFQFGVYSDGLDLTQVEIFDITGSPVSLAFANTSTGNIFSDNITLFGNPLVVMPGNTFLLELKANVDPSAVSDNVGIVLDPNDVYLAGGNNVSGNLINFGPIPLLPGGNMTGPATQVVITTPAADFIAGDNSILTIEIQDAGGNLVTSDFSTNVTFTPDNSGKIIEVITGTGDGAYGVSPYAEDVIVDGGVATVRVTATGSGNFNVTFSNDSALTDPPADSVFVTPGAPYQLVVTAAPANIMIGTTTDFEVSVIDQYFNLVGSDFSTNVTFTPSGSSNIVNVPIGSGDATYGTPGAPETVQVSAGQARITLSNSVAEAVSITVANDGGLLNPSATNFVVSGNTGPMPIAHYTFEGNLFDSVGSADLSEPLGTVNFAPGILGQAVDFSASVNYLKTANGALTTSSNFSMSFWMRAPDEGAHIPFLQTTAGAATGSQDNFDISPSGELRYWGGGSSFQTVTSPLIVDNVWHHIAIVSTGNTSALTIYIDGSSVPLTLTNGNQPANLQSTLYIGSRSDLTNNDTYDFTGLIDEVKIFNVAISPSDVNNLYAEGGFGTDFHVFNTGFTAPATAPSGNVTGVLEFVIEPEASEMLNEVNVYIPWGDGNDLSYAELRHVEGANVLSSTSTFGTSAFGFNGLGFNLMAGTNVTLQVAIDPVSMPGMSNIELRVEPFDVKIGANLLVDGEDIYSGIVEFVSAGNSGPQIGVWPLDDGSGTVATDISPNSNDGSFLGSPAWVTGLGGNTALAFNGSTDMVLIQDIPAYDSFPQLTLSTWVYPTVGGTAQALITKNAWGSSQREFVLSIGANDQVRFQLSGDGSTASLVLDGTNNGITPGQWNLVTATWDGTDGKIYINGALDAQAGHTGSIFNSSSNIQLGGYFQMVNHTNPFDFLNGNLQNVEILDVALSSSEVMDRYNAFIGPMSIAGVQLSPGSAPEATMVNDGDTNVFLMDFNLNLANGSSYEFIQGLVFDIPVGDPNTGDITMVHLYEGPNYIDSIAPMGGNVDFSTNLNFGIGGAVSFSVNVDISPSPVNPVFAIDLADMYVMVGGGNYATGGVVSSGNVAINTGGMVGPDLYPDPMFMNPGNLPENGVDIPAFGFEIDTTSMGYSGNIIYLEFDVEGADPTVELIGLSLHEVGVGPIPAGVNIIAGNIIFDAMDIPLSGGSNTSIELRVNTVSSFSADNIEFGLEPHNVWTGAMDAVGGSFVSYGPIPLGSGNMGADADLAPAMGFTPPMSVTAGNLEVVLSFDIYSSVSTTLDSITLDISGGAPADLVDVQLWSTSFGDYFLSYGSPSANTIFLSGNGTIFNPSDNLNFEIRIAVPDPATGSSFDLGINPANVSLGGGNQTLSGFPFGTGSVTINAGAPQGSSFIHSLIAAGRSTTFIAEPASTPMSSGRNDQGQLGRGGDPAIFDQIPGGLLGAISISAGESHGLALMADGNVFSWGSSYYGQSLGGAPQVDVSGIGSPIVFIEAGAHSSFVITDNNQLWAKGRNHKGQLGVGDTTDRTSWTQVSLPAGNIEKVSSGIEHTGVMIDGKIYGFGSNGFGQLAQSGTGHFTSWVGVNTNPIWIDFEAGGFHSLAIDSNNDLWAGGKNTHGQLGLGFTSFSVNPPQVASLTNVVMAVGGYDHSVVVTESMGNTTIHTAGANRFGQLDIAGAGVVSGFQAIDNPVNNGIEIDAGPYSTLIYSNDDLLRGAGQFADQIRFGLEILIDLSL